MRDTILNPISPPLTDVTKMLAYPSASSLVDEAAAAAAAAAPKAAPATDMWQQMQLRKQVEANREGIDKLMEMMNELIIRTAGVEKNEKEQKEFKEQLDILKGRRVGGKRSTLSCAQKEIDKMILRNGKRL